MEKQIHVDANGVEALHFFGDEGDLYEILGNLLDNAFKYGRSAVLVTGQQLAPRTSNESSEEHGLTFRVEDDGDGIPVDERQRVLERGRRVTDEVSGQGIGLSVVYDLVSGYGGRVEMEQSSLGGACVIVLLPRVLA